MTIRTGSAALRRIQTLDEATSRTFNGGLDVADSELNLSSKFARALSNMLPGIDGSLSVRQGCRLFADIASDSNFNILNEQYFSARIIVINDNAELLAVDGAGNVEKIWNSDIASAARKTTWVPSTYVKFDEFNGNLIVSDGVNKPLNITAARSVDYLADLATGSNINVPVSAITGKHDRHFIYAIDSIIHVSERDAAGSWSGDAGVVYAGQFDLGAYVTSGDKDIIGLLSYKGFLMVFFRECIVPVQFVEVAATATDPAFLKISVTPDSIIANYGTVSPRSLIDIGDMSLAMDIVGVSNVQLTSFTKILSPDRPSRLIDKLIQEFIARCDTTTLHDNVFAVYDRRLATYMLFIPNDDWNLATHMHGFGFRYIDSLKINAWFRMDDWRWRCGTRSSEGRIFFSRRDDTKIFVLGDEAIDPVYADYVGEQETFTDGTVYTDQTGNGPVASIAESGVPIKFVWELPRTDLKKRGLTKTLRYITIDAEGDQMFTLSVFIDNYYSMADNGEAFSDDTIFTDETGFIRDIDNLILTPALQSTRIAKDALGYGLQTYGTTPYGGGNNTGVERETEMPTKFKTMKLRFEGESMGPLKFVALTLWTQGGTIRRYAA